MSKPEEMGARDVINPDNPPWGVLTAGLVWFSSVALLFGVQLLILLPYALFRYRGVPFDEVSRLLVKDKTAILISVIATIPAHLLTIAVVWVLVTGFGKRPFWRTLGWSWGRGVGPLTSVGLAFLVLLVGWVVTWLGKGGTTEVDQIVASSGGARYAIALLATVTAPLVEEMVYRGVLYSALNKAAGMIWAVVIVSFLFAFVHVFQYSNNLGVIAAITIFSLSLTIMRAYSGRLLPCYVMHLVFNGLQSVLIVLEPHLQQPSTEQKAALLIPFLLARTLHLLT